MTFITAPKNNIKNINQTYIDCDIEIERFISSTFALAVGLLNINDLKIGSTLIDIGFEKTSLGLFKNLALVNSFTLPLGINHVVKDISKVCSLDLSEAKTIKDNINFSSIENSDIFDENDYLKDIFFTNSPFRKVSKKLMKNVIKSRLDEMLEAIKKQISVSGINLISENNIILTGGGSQLLNIEEYFSNFFEIEIKKLNINENNKNQLYFNNSFFSCLGAFEIIKDGWETEAIPKIVNQNQEKLGFFARIFGNG
jgi:cell division protein FtsA